MLEGIRKSRPGRPKGTKPVSFTAADDIELIKYMAKTSSHYGKTGLNYYDAMISNHKDKSEWAHRHPASAWQNRYSKNRLRFDEEIAKYITDPHSLDDLQPIVAPKGKTAETVDEALYEVDEMEDVVGEERRRRSSEEVSGAEDGGERRNRHPQSKVRTIPPATSPAVPRFPLTMRRPRKRAPPLDEEDIREMAIYALTALATEVGLRDQDVFMAHEALDRKFGPTRRVCYDVGRISEKHGIPPEEVWQMWFRLEKSMEETDLFFMRGFEKGVEERTDERNGGGEGDEGSASGNAIQPDLE